MYTIPSENRVLYGDVLCSAGEFSRLTPTREQANFPRGDDYSRIPPTLRHVVIVNVYRQYWFNRVRLYDAIYRVETSAVALVFGTLVYR